VEEDIPLTQAGLPLIVFTNMAPLMAGETTGTGIIMEQPGHVAIL